MSADKSIAQFLRELYDKISEIGIEKVVRKLNELNNPTFDDLDEKIKNHIISTVTKFYNTELSDISAKYVEGDNNTARRLCIVLLKKHLKLSYKEIANVFGRSSHSFVSVEIKKFSALTDRIPQDVEEQELFKRFNEDIIQFKKVLLMINE